MDLVSTALAPVHCAQRAAPAGPATFRLYTGSADLLLARRAGLIVTPNLDHLRLLSRSKALRRAYARADVIANDSRFLDRLAIRGAAACLPGADLAPDMLDTLAQEARVFVGARAGVSHRALPAPGVRLRRPVHGLHQAPQRAADAGR